MPSPTGVTRLVRKKKKSSQGKRRKIANSKVGRINFYKAFGGPASDDKITAKRA